MIRYVITNYIPNSNVDTNFLQALKKYCEYNSAKLMITECAQNYLTDIETHKVFKKNPDELKELQDKKLPIKKYLKTGDIQLNDNLFVSKMKVNVNIIDPLSGLEGLAARQGCLIISYPRQRFKMVPRMLKENQAPRAIWCTGTVSEPYYKDTKSGGRMAELHLKGALVVEIYNNRHFVIRQLQYDGKGFFDLTSYYTKDKVVKDIRVEGISLGDDHALFLNRKIVEKTKKLFKQLNPKHVFHHDTLDCASISHHVQHKHITKALINMKLEDELKLTSNYIKEMVDSTNAKHFLVASNHIEHLDKYLEEGRYVPDTFNHIMGLRLALEKAMGNNPIESALRMFNKLDRFKVTSRKDTMKLADIEMLCHGDYGSNGSRGNPKDVGLVYAGKVVSGHSHSCEIGIYGNSVNGTMTDLNLPYTNDSAGSKWFWCHTAVYANGTFTHLYLLPDEG